MSNPAALILFAHGARDPEWARPFEKIKASIGQRRPDLPVELAYLELMHPTLEEAVARLSSAGARRITVVPLFMAQGGHLKQDLPRMLDLLRAETPGVEIRVAPAIGDAEPLLAQIADWALAQAGS